MLFGGGFGTPQNGIGIKQNCARQILLYLKSYEFWFLLSKMKYSRNLETSGWSRDRLSPYIPIKAFRSVQKIVLSGKFWEQLINKQVVHEDVLHDTALE